MEDLCPGASDGRITRLTDIDDVVVDGGVCGLDSENRKEPEEGRTERSG
jgi:hypothetical protein